MALKPFSGTYDPVESNSAAGPDTTSSLASVPRKLKPFSGSYTPLGQSEQTGAEDKGVAGHLQDLGISAAKSVVSVPETVIGLGNLVSGGRLGRSLEQIGVRPGEAQKYLDMLYTPQYQAQQQQFSDADGILDKTAVALKNPSLIANTVVQSAAPMLAGGAVAQGLRAASPVLSPAAAGAVGEGTVMAGQQAEQIRQQTDNGELTPGQVGASVATGSLGTMFGYAGGRLAQRLGIGDVDTLLARGGAAQTAGASTRSIPRQVIEGAINEGLLEELPQSVSEQIIQNLALDKPWSQGVDEAAVMGTLAGMAMGSGASTASALANRRQDQQAQPSDALVSPEETGTALEPTMPELSAGEVSPSPASGEPAPEPAPDQLPAEDGSGLHVTRVASEPAASPSQQMGLDPEAGPLTAAAAQAVDSAVPPSADGQVILQNRDRSTPASIQQMQSIAARPDYSRLGFSRDFAAGAPVVEPGAAIPEDQLGKMDMATTASGRQIPVQYAAMEASDLLPSHNADGSHNAGYAVGVPGQSRVIAGNGRVAGLQAAWSRGGQPVQQYHLDMASDAALHGIQPGIISAMRNPVLVRVMPQSEITPSIGDESNTSGVSGLSPVEQARNDARRINLQGLKYGDDGQLSATSVRQFVAAMPQSERAGLMDGLRPGKTAYDRLGSAIFNAAYGSDDLTRLQAQAADPEARTVIHGLLQAAPSMSRLEGEHTAIRQAVTEAAMAVINARRAGQSLSELSQQQDMTRSPLSSRIIQLFADNIRSGKRIGQALTEIADRASQQDQQPDNDLLGNAPRQTPEQIVAGVLGQPASGPVPRTATSGPVEQPAASRETFSRIQTAPAEAQSQSQTAPMPAMSLARMPVIITNAMHSQLAGLGYSPTHIRKLKPQQAWDIIQSGLMADKAPMPVSATAVQRQISGRAGNPASMPASLEQLPAPARSLLVPGAGQKPARVVSPEMPVPGPGFAISNGTTSHPSGSALGTAAAKAPEMPAEVPAAVARTLAPQTVGSQPANLKEALAKLNREKAVQKAKEVSDKAASQGNAPEAENTEEMKTGISSTEDKSDRQEIRTPAESSPASASSSQRRVAEPTIKEAAPVRQGLLPGTQPSSVSNADGGDIRYRASTVTGNQKAKGMPVAEVRKIAEDFLAEYRGNLPLKLRVEQRQEDIYGPDATPERFGIIKGAYHGRAGLFTLAADNLSDRADARETLRHEILGHYGLNTLAPADKRALLEKIIASRETRSLKSSWDKAVRAYSEKSPLEQAEEVFAQLSEQEPGRLGETWNQILALLARALRRIGLLRNIVSRAELQDLARRIGRGIRDGSRVQQTFPGSDDAQFSYGPEDVFYRRDLQSGEAGQRFGQLLGHLTKTRIREQAGYRLTDFLKVGLQALGRRQLVDIYGRYLPLASYDRMVAQMEADKNEAGAGADELARRWAKLKDERQLAELMHDATLAQIDADSTAPAVDGDDQVQVMRLKSRFKALTPDAQNVYRQARDTYRSHHDRVRQALRERIMRADLRESRRGDLLRQMDSEFFGRLKGVYFPLARFGNYVVAVHDRTGKVASVGRAETQSEAEALRAQMSQSFPEKDGFTVSPVTLGQAFIANRDTVGRGFMASLYEALENQDMSAAQRTELEDTIGQLYLESMPDLSWAKHGIHRKGTPGFSQDARRAFAQNVFHGARYLAKLRYSDQLESELGKMQKAVDDWQDGQVIDQPRAQRVVDEFNKRHEALMNPSVSPWSTALTSLGFVWHLGLSPASAIANLLQTPMVAYPVLGAKWGYDKASAELLKAARQAIHGKNNIASALNADERKAYDEAVRSGVIDVTQAHDLAGIASGEDAGVMWKLRPVMRWASFLFHHAERFNRETTFVAAYRLARAAGTASQGAYDQAVKATYDGHYDYSASNRPRFMQGNVARVVLLFKQFAQNTIYLLARQAYLATSAMADPKEKTEARKLLSGLFVTHAMASGLLGLPWVVAGAWLSAASALGGDDDDPFDAQTALQNYLADAVGQKPAEVLAHGLSRLTPFDISGRVGLDHLIFPDVSEGLEGQRWAESFMSGLLGPVAGIGTNIVKGLNDLADGNTLQGFEGMLPAVVRGALRSVRYGLEGAQDRSGVSILDDVPWQGIAGQFVGFSPSEVRNATEGKSAITGLSARLGERRQALLSQFTRASLEGDQEGMNEIRSEIERFNQMNPAFRIRPNQLTQSIRNRRRRIDQAENGVYLPRNRRELMEEGRFAFGDG